MNIIPVFIPHAGCPNDCVFCNQRAVSGETVAPDAAQVEKYIEERLAVSKGKPQIAFYGGSFTAVEAEYMRMLLRAASRFVANGSACGIRVSTRPDAIDTEILGTLRRAGVTTIELGAQSMDEKVLEASGRGHTAQQVRRAACLIKSEGFALGLQMMTGLPFDTTEKTRFTANELCALSPDFVRIYPVVVLRGTRLYDMWQKGDYIPQSVDEAAQVCAELIEIFEKSGIPVIRAGLNPAEDLSGGDAVAGAYHPAFGEIAYSKIYLRRIREALTGTNGGSIEIYVANGCQSMAAGNKKVNKILLAQEFGLKNIKIFADNSLKKGEVRVKTV